MYQVCITINLNQLFLTDEQCNCKMPTTPPIKQLDRAAWVQRAEGVARSRGAGCEVDARCRPYCHSRRVQLQGSLRLGQQ